MPDVAAGAEGLVPSAFHDDDGDILRRESQHGRIDPTNHLQTQRIQGLGTIQLYHPR